MGRGLGLGREHGRDTTLRLPAFFTLVGEMLLDDVRMYPKWGAVLEARGQ